MVSKMLLLAGLVLGLATGVMGDDADDVDVKPFVTGTLSPGFALENDDDYGGICLRLERSFEVASLDANDQCNLPAAVEGSTRSLAGASWKVVKVDDDTVSLVNTNSSVTGATTLQLKVDVDDDDDLKFALAVDGYQFVGESTSNLYVLELSLGRCSERAIDDASAENKHATSASNSTSTSTDDDETSKPATTTTSKDNSNSTSKDTSFDDSSREISSGLSPSSMQNLRNFMRSVTTTRVCTVNGDDVSTEQQTIVCVSGSGTRFRLITQNHQGCRIVQSPGISLAVDGVLQELKQGNGASIASLTLSLVLAVVALLFV